MQNQSIPTADISLHDAVDIIRRRRGVILGCLIACLAIGAIVTLRSPRIYSASSQLVFYRPAYTVVLSGSNIAQPSMEDKSTQVYLLQGKAVADEASRYLAEKSVDVSGDEVRKSLRIRDIENTDLIEVSAETRDPRMSMLIANATADAFVLYKRDTSQRSQVSALGTLRRQLDTAKKELAVRERAVAEYAEKNAITDVKKESEARFQQIVAYEGKLLEAQTARAEARGRADELARQLSIQDYAIKVTGVIRDNKRISGLRDKLVDQELALAAAEQKYTAKFPGMLENLKDTITKTRAALAKEIDNIVNYKAGSLDYQAELKQKLSAQEADYVALAAKSQAIKQILAQVEAEIIKQPMKEVQMGGLVRASTAAAQVYTTLLNSYEAIKVDSVRQSNNVQVTELAVEPTSPIRPNPSRNMAFALVVAIIMGVFGALVMERLDDTLRTPEDVKRVLELPVLGQIPRMLEADRLLTDRHPRSPITEAYRKLRSNISFVGIDLPIRTLLITSATESEGKSLTCVNLAMTIAQEERTVMLVDSDLRIPSVELALGMLPGPGLTDVLRGQVTLQDALRPSGLPHLQVLTAGAIPPNPAEMIGSERMRALIEEMTSLADFVIFDSAPCNVVADAVILASRVDATIQVVDCEHVSREAAAQAREALTTARARIAGVVLNNVRAVPSAYHGYSDDDAGGKPRRSKKSSRKKYRDG